MLNIHPWPIIPIVDSEKFQSFSPFSVRWGPACYVTHIGDSIPFHHLRLLPDHSNCLYCHQCTIVVLIYLYSAAWDRASECACTWCAQSHWFIDWSNIMLTEGDWNIGTSVACISCTLFLMMYIDFHHFALYLFACREFHRCPVVSTVDRKQAVLRRLTHRELRRSAQYSIIYKTPWWNFLIVL